MRRLVLPAVGLLALGMAAQASVTGRTDNQSDQAGWFLLNEDASLKLVYGLPNSDQIALMMTCAPGDHQITVYGDVEPDLVSLKVVDNGPSLVDPLSGGDAYGMSLSTDDPGLRQLADQGFLPVRMESGPSRIQATPAERRLASHFLSACTRLHA
jgi:hypothetical protein